MTLADSMLPLSGRTQTAPASFDGLEIVQLELRFQAIYPSEHAEAQPFSNLLKLTISRRPNRRHGNRLHDRVMLRDVLLAPIQPLLGRGPFPLI